LVRWWSYGPAEDTWEPRSSLRKTAAEMVDQFDNQGRSNSVFDLHLEKILHPLHVTPVPNPLYLYPFLVMIRPYNKIRSPVSRSDIEPVSRTLAFLCNGSDINAMKV
jgi:hypothetical protein